MAAPQLEGLAQLRSGPSGTTVIADRPTTYNEGELLLGHIVLDHATSSSLPTVTIAPTGWVFIAGPQYRGWRNQWTYYKIATASEPTTYTWTFSHTASDAVGAAVQRISGIDPADPIDGSVSIADGAGTTVSWASKTTSVNDTLIVALGSLGSSTMSGWSGSLVEAWDMGTPFGIYGATKTQASAGATGTFTATSTVGDDWVTQTIAIQPPQADLTAPAAPTGLTATVITW